MSSKKDIRESLLSMGFSANYIDRAFTVYEKKYGYSYNVEVMTEVIVRLQNKDNAKLLKNVFQQPSQPNTYIPAFDTHLTLSEANTLKVKDKVDHRDRVGRYVLGTIVEKSGTNIKIHYNGWSRKWDEWCNYSNNHELNRLAKPTTISKRPAHRFKPIRKGDYIDINPTMRHPGWTGGKIRRLDKHSGQVQIVYEVDKRYLYWAHLDDEKEIAAFSGKVKPPSDEEICNPYNANDKLCVKNPQNNKWYNAKVINVHDNWIRVSLDGYDTKYNNSFHMIRDKKLLNLIWYHALSFQSLKATCLINCYNEWKSVKNAFGMNTKLAIEWLNKQKKPFKECKLSYILICGYGKSVNIPTDVQRIIASFCNFMFVKLIYCIDENKYEYRVLDTNITIRNLAKILEIENDLDPENKQYIYSNYVRIFARFGLIKEIYPIKTAKMEVKWNSLIMDNDSERWVEIPDDYTELSLTQLNHSITFDKVLEIGVGFVTFEKKKKSLSGNIWIPKKSFCSFNTEYDWNCNVTKDKWIDSLKIGDIIDVFDNYIDNQWRLGMIRYIFEYKLYIHYIGYHVKYDRIIDVLKESYDLRKRSLLPYRCMNGKKQKVNKIMQCWRTD
eukprot:110727_1